MVFNKENDFENRFDSCFLSHTHLSGVDGLSKKDGCKHSKRLQSQNTRRELNKYCYMTTLDALP